MLILASTSDLISVVSSSTANLDVQASWVDNNAGTITPGRTNTAISTATTTTVVASPAASTYRNVKYLSVRNKHASTSNDVTFRHTDGATVVELVKATLLAGERLEFSDGVGIELYNAAGALKTAYDTTIVGITGGTISGVTLTDYVSTLRAGTTVAAPMQFLSGTNLTTPAAGALEYDGTVHYSTHTGSSRGVALSQQFLALTSNYTLTSTTSVQKLFNVPTNGALTVKASTSYFFEGMIYVSGMSATSGNASIDMLGAGTATLTSTLWAGYGFDQTSITTAAAITGAAAITNASSNPIAVVSTGTSLFLMVKGIIRINAGGTIIPSIALLTAAAAVVQAPSFIRFAPVGTDTVSTVGNWS